MEVMEGGDSAPKRMTIVKSHDVIKIVSSDNKSFYVNKDVVCISKHLATILQSGFKEGESKVINLAIKTEILEICLKYLHYKLIYRNVSFERPPFNIAPEFALDVLKAAMYLQC
jgi:hypothetical protein